MNEIKKWLEARRAVEARYRVLSRVIPKGFGTLENSELRRLKRITNRDWIVTNLQIRKVKNNQVGPWIVTLHGSEGPEARRESCAHTTEGGPDQYRRFEGRRSFTQALRFAELQNKRINSLLKRQLPKEEKVHNE